MFHPMFWFLSVAANVSIFFGAFILYWLEGDTNPKLLTFLEAVWWSVSTVTTVGYGDIIPQTASGKILGIGLMIFGTAIFGAFTALFAAILLKPELDDVEDEVRELEKRFPELENPA